MEKPIELGANNAKIIKTDSIVTLRGFAGSAGTDVMGMAVAFVVHQTLPHIKRLGN
jgi:hypothetical protein